MPESDARIELTGFLVPTAPWSARLLAVASKAVILLHDDGAAIAVVGREDDADARAFVMGNGFTEFAAKAAGLLARADAEHAPGPRAVFDGRSLAVTAGEHGSSGGLGSSGALGSSEGPGCVMACSADASGAAVWDQRRQLAEAARLFSLKQAGREPAHSAGMALIEAVLAESRLAARKAGRAETGIHGNGPFARAFERLMAAPGFPLNLVGFGPGSTPAGDDWLAAYLAGRDLLDGGPGRSVPALRSALASSLARTTAAGRALLLGALAGAPPAYLGALILALAGHAPDGIRNATLAALGHGASSGEDALTGFLAALRRKPPQNVA